MTPKALALVLCASLFHATWNFLAKTSRSPVAFLWLSLVVGVALGTVPVALRMRTHPFPEMAWNYALLTGALHATYYTLLGLAYQKGGDLSAVYPVARGTAPLGVLLGAVILRQEWPSAAGVCGILFVVGGIGLISWPPSSLPALRTLFRPLNGGPLRLAFLTGLAITAYSLVDKAAMSLEGVDPWVYLYWISLFCVMFQLPWMLWKERQTLAKLARERPGSILGVAVMGPGTYGLILMALATPSPVSYIVASRECSILFAAILGNRILREGGGHWRLGGAALIAAGVATLAVAR
ncbi:MAG: EamA family transporter [Planctomycetes bacterium]|nr:EamA family transporter [Planctomycetota bacterium]